MSSLMDEYIRNNPVYQFLILLECIKKNLKYIIECIKRLHI